MGQNLIIKDEKGRSPIEQAEDELYPGIPYISYTKDMRFATYDRAKDIIFAKAGRRIPRTMEHG